MTSEPFTDQPARKAIYRYEVPVDGQVHAIELSGKILHVASRRPEVVEFWALSSGGVSITRRFRVYGTGHTLPEGPVTMCGTALDRDYVWHLVDVSNVPVEVPAA